MKDAFAPEGIYVVDASAAVNNQLPSHPGHQTTVTDKQGEKKSKQHRQWIAAIIATLTLFLMGMFIGWPSPVIKKLQGPDAEIRLTDEEISWMVSLVYLGSMISPLPTGVLMDHCGRKAGLLLTALEALLAWIILLTTHSVGGIYLARFLGGMVGGSGYTVAPIYLSEIAEPEVRGALNSIFTLMAYIGAMFEYCIGPYVSYTLLNILSLLIPLFITIFLYFIPESPYYYTMKENKEAAIKSLVWLRCAESSFEVENELNNIERAVSENMKNKKGISELIKTRGNRRALLMTETLAILQRLSGISVIMAYAAKDSPASLIISNDQCVMLFCLTWIIFGVWGTALADRLGRKFLTILSCSGCGFALASVAGWNYLDKNTNIDVSFIDWFPFAALILYSAFFPIGLGTVPNMIQGEVFPANIKGVASGCTSIVIALTSFITNKMYQPIGRAVGIYLNYCIFSVSCVYGIYFGTFVLIETKGKTLEKIQEELSSDKTLKSSKKVAA